MFELRQSLFLFITATIWGSGFIGQSIGMDHVEPFTFTFFRTLIGGIVLLPVIAFMRKIRQRGGRRLPHTDKKALLLGSLACGACLIAAESFQQFGLKFGTDAGKAGFITSMYIIFVPLLTLFTGRRIRPLIWLAVALSVAGLYLLCIKGELSFERGDLMVFICAIVFAVHILVIAYFVDKVDGILLSCGQFFAASFIGLILMLVHDTVTWEGLRGAAPALLYVGIMSNGVAYTLQIVGQRGMNPAVATIILSLESVMATIFGILILNESLTLRELMGCVLMFIAVLMAQWPQKKTEYRDLPVS
ncbi:MAG TPA: DMT family transporter [Candidatus Avisuccinivibrio pullicola]|nr:DMT family transporter [Candidatus Avisuccinivibrio pullicola]